MQTGTRIGIGVLVTACLFALLIFFVGIEEFFEAVASMDPQLAAAVVSAIAVRRLFHGLIVYAAFARFEVTVSYLQAVFISASVSFAKKATPLAQLSGEPIAAGIITDAIDDTYEDSLAAISVIETVKFVPAMTVFVVGSTYFVVFPTAIPSSIRPIFGLFGAVLLLVPLVGIVLWSYKDRAEAIATAAVVALANAVSVIPRVPSPNEEDIRNRISGFSSRFVDLTTNRRLVVELSILTFCTLFLTVLALWIALGGVGVAVPLPIVLFAVPFSKLASAVPSPGGVGGVEGVLVIFITSLTAHSIEQVTTGVIISSGVAYWMTALVGGLGIAFVLPLLSSE